MVLLLPGLDSVTYFPVLSVTVGILVQLIVRCGGTRLALVDSLFVCSVSAFLLPSACLGRVRWVVGGEVGRRGTGGVCGAVW